jgi:hypothetical protein
LFVVSKVLTAGPSGECRVWTSASFDEQHQLADWPSGIDEVAALPIAGGLCCPPGSTNTTAASESLPAGHPLAGVIGYRTPRSGDTPQATGPGRVSRVSAATI